MRSYIYFIIFLCYENYATALVRSAIVGNSLFENVLMDMKPYYAKNISIPSLQEQNSYEIKRLTEAEKTVIQNKNAAEINEYFDYLNDNIQTDILFSIQYYDTYLQINTSDPFRVSDEFSSNYEKYFKKTFHIDDAINDIDKQFVLFDLMETSSKMLFNTKMKIIKNMTETKNVNFKTNAILLNQYYKLLDEIHKERVNKKKDEIKNICETFDICRVFPTYSDYISDLIYEVLYLSNARLDNMMSQVIVLIKEKITFFKEFLGDELTRAVGDKVHSLFNVDDSELRHVLSMFKQVLHQRHKFSSRKNHNSTTKAKAIRILIDIIDRAFEKDDDEILLMYISITKNGLRDWASMKEYDLRSILANFIRYITNNLKYNWSHDTKKEVRTLVEVLMKSKVRSEDVYEYLFSKGSQFVKNPRSDDIYLDLI